MLPRCPICLISVTLFNLIPQKICFYVLSLCLPFLFNLVFCLYHPTEVTLNKGAGDLRVAYHPPGATLNKGTGDLRVAYHPTGATLNKGTGDLRVAKSKALLLSFSSTPQYQRS